MDGNGVQNIGVHNLPSEMYMPFRQHLVQSTSFVDSNLYKVRTCVVDKNFAQSTSPVDKV